MTTDTTTAEPTTDQTEEDLHAQYAAALALVAEWEERLRAVEAAQAEADATASADVIDHPEQVEKIAQARSEAVQRVRVTREVLDRARAAALEAGRRLLPFAAERYDAEAAEQDRAVAAWNARLTRHVTDLEKMTGSPEWARLASAPYDEPERLAALADRARRDAAFCRWAQVADAAVIAEALRDARGTGKQGKQQLDAALDGHAGVWGAWGGVHPEALRMPTGAHDLPAELQQGGCYPVA